MTALTRDTFPIIGPKNLKRSPPRNGLARTAQPGKLRIQGRDRFGGGFQGRNGMLDGLQRSVPLGAQGSAVAPVGSSAARSNAAQILGGLVKQDMGVVGHGVSRHTIHHFTRANYQVQSAGWAQIPPMKRRWSLWHAWW